MTITIIQKAVTEFRDVRDWRQFHSPKNLSMSIAIESAELMEHFQWTDGKHIPDRQAVLDELADILIYCFSLADILDCDITQIILDKLAKNNRKYPSEQYQGKYRKEK